MAAGTAGCGSAMPPSHAGIRNFKMIDASTLPGTEEYLLQVGDTVDIKFFYNAELNETVTVRPDGRITLQLVDDVHVARLKPSEVDRILTEKYSSVLRNPEVTVIVKTFASYKVYVGGEVHSPGAIDLSGQMTVLQAVFQAGGAKDSGELRHVVVMRNQGTEEPLFIHVNLKGDLAGQTHGDMLLRPHDIVFIPKTEIAKANQFVRQYISELIPITLSFGMVYNLNPEMDIK